MTYPGPHPDEGHLPDLSRIITWSYFLSSLHVAIPPWPWGSLSSAFLSWTELGSCNAQTLQPPGKLQMVAPPDLPPCLSLYCKGTSQAPTNGGMAPGWGGPLLLESPGHSEHTKSRCLGSRAGHPAPKGQR
jgi:hypothetical protein